MGSNEVSFGIDRVEQLADDIAELDPKASQIMVIGDVGIAQAGIDRSLSGRGIEPDDLARIMMSPENLPMIDNNARPISKHDGLELARRILIG
jgi:hypothetical protein